MYLTQQGDDKGWSNWQGGETFIKEYNHVLTNRKTQNDLEKPTEARVLHNQEELEKFRDVFFDYEILTHIQKLFGPGSVIVTENDDNPVGIRLKDTFYIYFGVMRNLLHMSCWLSFPDKFQEKVTEHGKEYHILCCFLFKSRSQKLSEFTFEVDDDVGFDLTSSPEYE